VDLESITRWDDYSRAKDEMVLCTDTGEEPWSIMDSDDKRWARINMIGPPTGQHPLPGGATAGAAASPNARGAGYRRPEKNPGNHPYHAGTLC
jgi:polyphosphate kinase